MTFYEELFLSFITNRGEWEQELRAPMKYLIIKKYLYLP